MAGTSKNRKSGASESAIAGFHGLAIDYQLDMSPTSIKGTTKELTGYLEKELLNGESAWIDIIAADDLKRMKSELKKLIKTSPGFRIFREYTIVHKDETQKPVVEQLQCLVDKKGKPVSLKGMIFENSLTSARIPERKIIEEEVKKRKRAESEFLNEKDFLNNILDSFSYPFYVIDVESYKVTLANKTAREMFGNNAKTCYELSHRRTTPCDKTCLCPLKTVQVTKEPCLTEHIHFDKDNNPRYFSVHGFPIFNSRGEVHQIIEYSIETTEQRKAELAVMENEEKYRLLFENERDAILLLDAETHRVIDANIVAAKLYQYEREKLLKMKVTDFSAEPDETIKSIDTKEVGETSKIDLHWHKKKDDTVFPVEITAGFFHWKGRKTVCAIIRDITERREREELQARLEKRLTTTQKMNAIGTLAGGIAHDFNNLLFAQIGYLEMAVAKLSKDHECYTYVDESLKASMRAADLVKQILTFSRSDHELTEPISIAPILKETIKMLQSSVASQISISSNVDTQCHNVIGNPVQIQQIILNLASNSEFAMKNTGGQLHFELKDVELEKKEAKSYGFDDTGMFVSLVVSDTGVGMKPDVKEQMFEPYFTTKPYWQGAGMGLAVVHSIVENNMEGMIAVESEPGKGTQINMLFPALVEGKEIPKSAFVEEKKNLLKNQVVILFIDDEEMICSMGKTILSNLGFHVIAHTDPVDAINTFKKDARYIDLVITDHIMPGMSGIQLAREINAIKPDMQIILMDADKVEMTEGKLNKIGISQTVNKPVSKHTLAKTISKVLKQKKI